MNITPQELKPCRDAFEAHFKKNALDFELTKDAWDRPIYQHSHVQALFDGWCAALKTRSQSGDDAKAEALKATIGWIKKREPSMLTNKLIEGLENTLATLQPISGDTSDGYHTFNELYEHRHALFLAVCKAYKDRAWKSKAHSDGSMFEGWFIAGLATTHGQATYHLPLRLWDAFDVEEMPVSPPWDGHTPDDVIKRISSLTKPAKPDLPAVIAGVIDGLMRDITRHEIGSSEYYCDLDHNRALTAAKEAVLAELKKRGV